MMSDTAEINTEERPKDEQSERNSQRKIYADIQI